MKTVEKDLSKHSDSKETYYTSINRLNNEQKQLNEKISRLTNQAAAAERAAREKEDAFKRAQESTKRKDELNDQLKQLTEQDKDADRQMVPIRTQLMQKESDIKRMRDDNAREDKELGDKLKDFERDMDKLNGKYGPCCLVLCSYSYHFIDLTSLPSSEINDKIDEYTRSNKDNEIKAVDQKLLENAENTRGAEEEIAKIKPDIEHLKKQVEDR